MSSLTSLPKRGGFEHSKLSGNTRGSLKITACFIIAASLLFVLPEILAGDTETAKDEKAAPAFVATKVAAAQCRAKLKSVEDFADRNKAGQTQSTRFTEDEINSYLALDLKPRYDASLKNLVVHFKEDSLQAIVSVDFDQLGSTSSKFLPRLIGMMISGIHTITANGKLLSKNGKANFVLGQALFDTSTLPKFLVEEIISAVGRKQKPPFDPLRPSRMPYEINRVEVHPGYIMIYQ